MKACINPETLLPPAAAYSHVVKAGDLVFLSGMVPFDLDKKVVGNEVRAQTRKVLENMTAALEAVGGTLAHVCTVTAYLAELERDFAGFNEVYAEFFPRNPPVRATVGAELLGFLVEIQAAAVIGEA